MGRRVGYGSGLGFDRSVGTGVGYVETDAYHVDRSVADAFGCVRTTHIHPTFRLIMRMPDSPNRRAGFKRSGWVRGFYACGHTYGSNLKVLRL